MCVCVFLARAHTYLRLSFDPPPPPIPPQSKSQQSIPKNLYIKQKRRQQCKPPAYQRTAASGTERQKQGLDPRSVQSYRHLTACQRGGFTPQSSKGRQENVTAAQQSAATVPSTEVGHGPHAAVITPRSWQCRPPPPK